jgi:urease accessory protein
MESIARVVVERGRAGPRFRELRSAPPLTLRRVGTAEVAVVSSAATPVGGDSTRLEIVVGDGVELTVRAIAASVAHPGPRGTASEAVVAAEVGAGATLTWRPGAVVLVDGCDHHGVTDIALDESARLSLRDVVVMGRWMAPSGSVCQRLLIDRGGAPLVRSELSAGPRWPGTCSPAVLGPDDRAVATAVEVGPHAPPPQAGADGTVAWSVHPLEPDAAVWTYVGPTAAAVTASCRAGPD